MQIMPAGRNPAQKPFQAICLYRQRSVQNISGDNVENHFTATVSDRRISLLYSSVINWIG